MLEYPATSGHCTNTQIVLALNGATEENYAGFVMEDQQSAAVYDEDWGAYIYNVTIHSGSNELELEYNGNVVWSFVIEGQFG